MADNINLLATSFHSLYIFSDSSFLLPQIQGLCPYLHYNVFQIRPCYFLKISPVKRFNPDEMARCYRVVANILVSFRIFKSQKSKSESAKVEQHCCTKPPESLLVALRNSVSKMPTLIKLHSFTLTIGSVIQVVTITEL